mmetsp:Transcript_7490/g.6789  ORF Transcript_7490/g.6789 Transcript_7490/m.6789 type:complete len:214 (-) Transcript_7490:25-666(-)
MGIIGQSFGSALRFVELSAVPLEMVDLLRLFGELQVGGEVREGRDLMFISVPDEGEERFSVLFEDFVLFVFGPFKVLAFLGVGHGDGGGSVLGVATEEVFVNGAPVLFDVFGDLHGVVGDNMVVLVGHMEVDPIQMRVKGGFEQLEARVLLHEVHERGSFPHIHFVPEAVLQRFHMDKEPHGLVLVQLVVLINELIELILFLDAPHQEIHVKV